MALSEFETKRVKNLVSKFINKKRPPAHLRDKVDLSFRITGQSVEIFEIRALWNDPSKKNEELIAKATYVKTSRVWKIFCKLCDQKWHSYEPEPEVESIEDFLTVVDNDQNGCFFG